MEILNMARMVNEKDSEIREQKKENEDKVNKKDAKKGKFKWNLVDGISMTVLIIARISVSIVGEKFDFKLPKKSCLVVIGWICF